MCNWFQNKSPTHTFSVDWDTRHGNWAAPCYFNGASPTGSARWGYCLQRHLACEGLYWAHNRGRKWLHPKGNHHPQEIKPLVWWRMPGSPEGLAGPGQESSTESRIERGNHISFQKVTGEGSATLQPEEMPVMGRICIKAVSWNSYKACVG